MAQESNFDDALLLSRENFILDGPTFACGWVKDGEIFTPHQKKLGLLPSTTLEIIEKAVCYPSKI